MPFGKEVSNRKTYRRRPAAGSSRSRVRPAEPLETYRYRPLLNVSQDIRLLELLHGDFDDKIYFQIAHFTLAERPDSDQDPTVPRFEALSYTWGWEEYPVNAFVATVASSSKMAALPMKMALRQNLASAPRHLQDPVLPRTLWVGAVCMN